jgi:V-type H+-transporting ATPase subunit a
MDFFRSEDMALFEISIPKDADWSIMNELGSLSCMHFIDLNKQEQIFSLKHANRIKRCEDTEKRLKFLISECERHQIPLNKPESV